RQPTEAECVKIQPGCDLVRAKGKDVVRDRADVAISESLEEPPRWLGHRKTGTARKSSHRGLQHMVADRSAAELGQHHQALDPVGWPVLRAVPPAHRNCRHVAEDTLFA